MVNRKWMPLAALALIAFSAAQVEAGPLQRANVQRTEARIDRPGDYEFAFAHGGGERRYLVHVPKGYDPTRPSPMVLALHGGGGGMRYQANDANYGLISASERHGFIAVFPNGYAKNRLGLFATWNAGACCGPARDAKIDDVGFLKSVIERMQRQTSIDANRIYSIGMSNGAMMSYRLACEIPEIIRGVMAVAGTDNTLQCTPEKPVPILHVHALNDDHVLYDGGAGENAFRDRGAVTDFASVAATVSKWVELNSAQPKPARVLAVDGAWCDLFAAKAKGAPVKLCVTERGGHSWPGGTKSRADEPPSQAINANDLMWAFFSGL